MRPGSIDPAHLILALFRIHVPNLRLPNPANFSRFSRQLKVIIATHSPLMHRAIGERGQHPTFLIQPLIAKQRHTRLCTPALYSLTVIFAMPLISTPRWAATKGRWSALNCRI
jgi:hypothetical protein